MEKILEILGSIGFDWHVALANFINFLIVLYLLNRFVFSKIKVTLKERHKIIEKGLEDAQKAETARIMAEEKEKEILRTAQIKANEIVSKANHKGNELIKKAEEKGLAEGKVIISKAKLETDRQKSQAETEIKKQAIDLVVSSVEKVLIKEMTADDHDTFIKKILNRAKKTI